MALTIGFVAMVSTLGVCIVKLLTPVHEAIPAVDTRLDAYRQIEKAEIIRRRDAFTAMGQQ